MHALVSIKHDEQGREVVTVVLYETEKDFAMDLANVPPEEGERLYYASSVEVGDYCPAERWTP